MEIVFTFCALFLFENTKHTSPLPQTVALKFLYKRVNVGLNKQMYKKKKKEKTTKENEIPFFCIFNITLAR